MKRKSQVLVVDDDQVTRTRLGEYFMSRDNDVVLVSNWTLGVEAMKRSKFDLVLTVFKGVEAAQELSLIDPKAHIVVLTSDPDQDAQIRNAGFETLEKPFGLPDIQEIVMKWEREGGGAGP